MNKFKVGDRVRAYGNYPTKNVGGIGGFLRGSKATVTDIISDTEIRIRPDSRDLLTAEVHPKQCRTLKTKKRRVWVDLQGLEKGIEFLVATDTPHSTDQGDWIEFVEIKKKPRS